MNDPSSQPVLYLIICAALLVVERRYQRAKSPGKERFAMKYYCLKIKLSAEVVNYLNRIGVSIVPEEINGERYLRLDCPEGTQEEYADIVTQETMYRVVTPSRGIFYIRYLRRPKLPNGHSQCLLRIYTSDMQRMEGASDATQAD